MFGYKPLSSEVVDLHSNILDLKEGKDTSLLRAIILTNQPTSVEYQKAVKDLAEKSSDRQANAWKSLTDQPADANIRYAFTVLNSCYEEASKAKKPQREIANAKADATWACVMGAYTAALNNDAEKFDYHRKKLKALTKCDQTKEALSKTLSRTDHHNDLPTYALALMYRASAIMLNADSYTVKESDRFYKLQMAYQKSMENLSKQLAAAEDAFRKTQETKAPESLQILRAEAEKAKQVAYEANKTFQQKMESITAAKSAYESSVLNASSTAFMMS